jgi:hypothetical protein
VHVTQVLTTLKLKLEHGYAINFLATTPLIITRFKVFAVIEGNFIVFTVTIIMTMKNITL